jgi:hypothetical protein
VSGFGQVLLRLDYRADVASSQSVTVDSEVTFDYDRQRGHIGIGIDWIIIDFGGSTCVQHVASDVEFQEEGYKYVTHHASPSNLFRLCVDFSKPEPIGLKPQLPFVSFYFSHPHSSEVQSRQVEFQAHGEPACKQPFSSYPLRCWSLSLARAVLPRD